MSQQEKYRRLNPSCVESLGSALVEAIREHGNELPEGHPLVSEVEAASAATQLKLYWFVRGARYERGRSMFPATKAVVDPKPEKGFKGWMGLTIVSPKTISKLDRGLNWLLGFLCYLLIGGLVIYAAYELVLWWCGK